MAKKITKKIKLQIEAAKATPAPPLGPALGQAGINIGDFVTKYNAATQKMAGDKVSVLISVYEDRSFTFIIKTPPASHLIKEAVGITSGSSTPNTNKVGKIKLSQIEAIAKQKMPDLTAADMEAAKRTIAGTARSMGIDVVEG